MDISNIDKAEGHWLLSKMGKRVLRPGGKELSLKLVDALTISSNDDLVEFALGMGEIASLLIENKPRTYTGIDADLDGVNNLQEKFKVENIRFIHSKASNTGLKQSSVDKLIGEAMLTVHADPRKIQIIKEANRILKTGGRYGKHELALKPDSILEDEGLVRTIKIGFNALINPKAMKMILNMGRIFRKYESNMYSVAIIA